MKAFMNNHPFWFALGLTVLISIVGLVIVVAGRALGLPQDSLLFAVVILSAVIPLGFIGTIFSLGWQGSGEHTRSTVKLKYPCPGISCCGC